jgi:septum formation protein
MPASQQGKLRFVLASASPRRRELLTDAGYLFDVIAPDDSAETGTVADETPAALVVRLAKQKAADVAPRCPGALIVACDTVVACGGRILGKPRDRDDARGMLQLLSGRVHEVYSGLCLWQTTDQRCQTRTAVTRLRMAPVTERQIEDHLDTGDWEGKAGAFGFQDGLDWLVIEDGSVSNVVGLPMELLAEMLRDWDAAV